MKSRVSSYAAFWTLLIVLGLVVIGQAQVLTWEAQPGYANSIQAQINALKAASPPSPAAGQAGYYSIVNATGTAVGLFPLVGDCSSSASTPGSVTCTKTNGVSFGPFATQTAPCTVAQGCTNATTANAGFNNLSPVTALGDLIYGSGINTNARLAGNTTANKQFLTQTGTGTASAAPSWGAIASTDINAALLTPGNIGTGTAPAIIASLSYELFGGLTGTITLLATNTAGSNTATFGALTGNVMVSPNEVGPVQAQRVTTGSLTTATYNNITITWTTAFADANYTASCSVLSSVSAAQGLEVDHIQSIGAASIVVTVNNPTGGSLTGTLECLAVHD